MNQDFVIDLAQRSIRMTALLGAPVLISALLVGVLVSILQAITQINKQTLAFIPKIIVVGVVLMVTAPWMIELMTSFTREIILDVPLFISK